jgi:hypothetical protein
MTVERILLAMAATPFAATASSGKTGAGVVISTIGSERATTGNNNKIVTYQAKSRVVRSRVTQKATTE